MSSQFNSVAIIGAGNIGTCIAEGLAESGLYKPKDLTLTRRNTDGLAYYKEKGFNVTSDNNEAVRASDIILIAVEPHQIDGVLKGIHDDLDIDRHLLISVAASVNIATIRRRVGSDLNVVRAMPNTAIAISESMTCLASDSASMETMEAVKDIFDTVGETLLLEEEQMVPATALGACGIAFFLRAIRAASQGGIETGLSSNDALKMAAQTARGAASLLLKNKNHPEFEIDKVTTPLGCTIAGLNQLEHKGFSSAMISGIRMSADKAAKLYKDED